MTSPLSFNSPDTTSIGQAISIYASEIAKTRDDLIYMNLGQPATGAPIAAQQALTTLMQHNPLGYTATQGIPELRERISEMYYDHNNVEISPDNILITYGASAALMIICSALFKPNDEIAVPVPFYNNYLASLQLLHLKLNMIETHPNNNYSITIEQLEALPSTTKAIVLINPNNPTGSIIPNNQLNNIINYCESKGIIVISDEVYHHITYNQPATLATAYQYSNNAIIINSFSKYYSLAGWRVGWMIVPDQLVSIMQEISRSYFVSPPAASQYVALATMDCHDTLQQSLSRYTNNRQIILDNINNTPFNHQLDLDGAFYCYAQIEKNQDSILFCKKMIKECGIVTTPGAAFDPINGHHHIRFSYAGNTNDIQEAMSRISQWQPT